MSSRHKLIGIILAISVVFDQLTKLVASMTLKGRAPIVSPGNFFRLEYSENPGAFLSLGATLSPSARFWLLAILVAIFLLLVLVYLIRSKTMDHLQTISLSLVLSGGIGNLIDRLAYGHVVDFMNMGIGQLRTGIFNVADVAIMAGAAVLLVCSFKGEKTQHPPTKPAATSTP